MSQATPKSRSYHHGFSLSLSGLQQKQVLRCEALLPRSGFRQANHRHLKVTVVNNENLMEGWNRKCCSIGNSESLAGLERGRNHLLRLPAKHIPCPSYFKHISRSLVTWFLSWSLSWPGCQEEISRLPHSKQLSYKLISTFFFFFLDK